MTLSGTVPTWTTTTAVAAPALLFRRTSWPDSGESSLFFIFFGLPFLFIIDAWNAGMQERVGCRRSWMRTKWEARCRKCLISTSWKWKAVLAGPSTECFPTGELIGPRCSQKRFGQVSHTPLQPQWFRKDSLTWHSTPPPVFIKLPGPNKASGQFIFSLGND